MASNPCFTLNCYFWGTTENQGLCSYCVKDTNWIEVEEERERRNILFERQFTRSRIQDYAFGRIQSETLISEIESLQSKDHISVDQCIQEFNNRMKRESFITETKGITAATADEIMGRFFTSDRESYKVSNMLAHKWVVNPWNLNSKFNNTGVCYFGNLGSFPYKDSFDTSVNLSLPRDHYNYLTMELKPGVPVQNL